MNILKKMTVVALFFYLPFSSMAWGVLGHRIVGEVAENYLTAAAKSAITKILGTESIAMASNWADFIKSDTSFAYLSTWHYLDFTAGQTKEEMYDYLEKDTATDAYTKINLCVKKLKTKNLPAGDKVFYLRLLIHIVGDIHQPLHVGHTEDKGGNGIQVSWFNASSNLHRVWDEQLINFQQLSYTEYTAAINHPTPAQIKEWQKTDLKAWIFDTYQSAEIIYNDMKNDEKETKLSYGYNFKFIGTVNTQLLKGGVRLAGLLNEIFAKG